MREIEKAIARGAYSEALAAIAALPIGDRRNRFERAIAIRRRDFAGVIALVESSLAKATGEDRVVDRAYLAWARRNQGAGTADLDLPSVAEVKNPRARADVAWCLAQIALLDGDVRALRLRLDEASPRTAEQRLRHRALRAWEFGLRGDPLGHVNSLANALSMAMTGIPDVAQLAEHGAVLAGFVRELNLEDVSESVIAVLERIDLPIEFAPEQAQVSRALAWSYSNVGQIALALQTLMRSSARANIPASTQGALAADRARISRWIGETLNADAATVFAFESFEHAAVRGELTIGNAHHLLEFFGAFDILVRDYPRLSALMGRLTEPVDHVSPPYRARVVAFDQFARAYLGSVDAAAAAYQGLRGHRVGYRSGAMALWLYEATNERVWLQRARKALAEYPQSDLVESLARYEKRIDGPRGAVLQALVQGLTVAQTAQRLKLAPATVRGHIRKLHRDAGVERRSQLVRWAIDRHLVADA